MMNRYPIPQYLQQTRVTRRYHAQVKAFALYNRMSIDQNMLGVMISVVVIIVLLLSRKSLGG